MSESYRRPIFNVYIDDSGTRHPDYAEPTSTTGDWFALGGIIVREEDEGQARDLHATFCEKWSITYPLHSVKIRHRSAAFSWLKTSSAPTVTEFYSDLQTMMISLPAFGHACVIDRPGYRSRYYEKHGRQRWHLCKTAFCVLSERVAKLAMQHDRRVRLWVEETDKKSDSRIREYFKLIRNEGMPFAEENSNKYGPMNAESLKFRLLDLNFKRKSSPLMQLADLYLYPICRGKYEDGYSPHQRLLEHQKLIDHQLADGDIAHMGIKYSCFD